MDVGIGIMAFIISFSLFGNPIVSNQIDKQAGVDQSHCSPSVPGNCR